MNKSKQLSETCAEIVGFLFREMLNELLEASLEVKQHSDDEKKLISSNEIFEACRLLKLDKNSLLYKFNVRQQANRSINANKKCNFF